jgi:hypothetical protein
VRDDAALHEIDHHRREARLHDVTTEHDDHRLFRSDRVDHGVDDFQEIARNEDIRETVEKVGD